MFIWLTILDDTGRCDHSPPLCFTTFERIVWSNGKCQLPTPQKVGTWLSYFPCYLVSLTTNGLRTPRFFGKNSFWVNACRKKTLGVLNLVCLISMTSMTSPWYPWHPHECRSQVIGFGRSWTTVLDMLVKDVVRHTVQDSETCMYLCMYIYIYIMDYSGTSCGLRYN